MLLGDEPSLPGKFLLLCVTVDFPAQRWPTAAARGFSGMNGLLVSCLVSVRYFWEGRRLWVTPPARGHAETSPPSRKVLFCCYPVTSSSSIKEACSSLNTWGETRCFLPQMLLRAPLLSAGKIGLNSRAECFWFIVNLPQKNNLGTHPPGKTGLN